MSALNTFMSFPLPCIKVKFLRRPQRFLAEICFPDGTRSLAYCANPGSFKGCLKAGCAAVVWDSNDPTRKRRYTLRAVKVGGVWVGTDTHLANRIVEEAFRQKMLPQFKDYPLFARERPFGNKQRVDFLLTGTRGLCFVEVKSSVVVEAGVARFPDSVTPRGQSHLRRLTEAVQRGHRAAIIFLVQRGDAKCFKVSGNCDPAYEKAFRKALVAGVEALAFAVNVTPKGFGKLRMLPFNKVI